PRLFDQPSETNRGNYRANCNSIASPPRTSVVSSELRVEALMPFIVTHPADRRQDEGADGARGRPADDLSETGGHAGGGLRATGCANTRPFYQRETLVQFCA